MLKVVAHCTLGLGLGYAGVHQDKLLGPSSRHPTKTPECSADTRLSSLYFFYIIYFSLLECLYRTTGSTNVRFAHRGISHADASSPFRSYYVHHTSDSHHLCAYVQYFIFLRTTQTDDLLALHTIRSTLIISKSRL